MAVYQLNHAQHVSVWLSLYGQIERLRIFLHLWRVELKLRSANVAHLPGHLQRKRALNIRRLRTYRKEGLFPKNLDFRGAFIPYFKDATGTPCAVAYLMEQSGQRDIVADVAVKNNHVYVNDIKDGPVLIWIKQSGLTQQEAARIQPSYSGWVGGFESSYQTPHLVDLFYPAAVNITVISGLTIALAFLLSRSYLASLCAGIGKKRFYTVMITTLVMINVVSLLTHFVIYDGYGTRNPDISWAILLVIAFPLFIITVIVGLIKLFLYFSNKKRFISSLIIYPLTGIVLAILLISLPIMLLLLW